MHFSREDHVGKCREKLTDDQNATLSMKSQVGERVVEYDWKYDRL